MGSNTKTVLTEKEMGRTLERLAYEVLERHGDCEHLAIIGIQRRGVDLAARLKAILEERADCRLPMGKLDINLYRDDWTTLDVQPNINHTEIGFEIDGRPLLIIDDVLFTGRTIRAALEAILDYGRPSRVELLVLVDRGHRELPIHADYVGKTVSTERGQHVDVFVQETDGKDEAVLEE
ncbi:MAG: bifunctional pyr operon transcriptional regulator/uracil phosphoribosyltransferase PyrR [Desulfovibrionaceae bacterium]|jgi:pyrimidine operon attenuation protein/uracil phosphoribosyltransferase|nr:bifunctional pyr operon transcriptional regulator/uracil phosphoribosyltransferase PyrR [Desulfovibrionaceae bacterium]